MKRSLDVVGIRSDVTSPALIVKLGTRLVSVADAYDGRAALCFAGLLCDAGGQLREGGDPADCSLRIVVRTALDFRERYVVAEALEAGADVVIGSARPSLACILARREIGRSRT